MTVVYNIYPAVDNPLFEGLALFEPSDTLESWPKDSNERSTKLWEPKLLKPQWRIPEVVGNVRSFNDYPGLNLSYPAFSQRAVDVLGDVLNQNGELLPLRHTNGSIYYYYNCTRLVDAVDWSKSVPAKGISPIERLFFFESELVGLSIFRERKHWTQLFCMQSFVDLVQRNNLNGFVFAPIWPLPEGATYRSEFEKVMLAANKWKPKDAPELDIKGNTVVLRLYCQRKKPIKAEMAALESVMKSLESVLFDPNQTTENRNYFGNVEGHDVVDHEIRVFISAPDCDRLIDRIVPVLRQLPWPGKFHVLKRRGEFVDREAPEEYVRIT